MAVVFPPETICKEDRFTVGLVASIFTLARAVDAAVVAPPSV